MIKLRTALLEFDDSLDTCLRCALRMAIILRPLGGQGTFKWAVTETMARRGNRLLRSLRGITIRRLCRLEGEKIVFSWLSL
jgi:hypothetical protein